MLAHAACDLHIEPTMCWLDISGWRQSTRARITAATCRRCVLSISRQRVDATCVLSDMEAEPDSNSIRRRDSYMKTTTIFDSHGDVIVYIDEHGTEGTVLRGTNRVIYAYYDADDNCTRDASNRIIARD